MRSRPAASEPRPRPGDGLLHPVALVALAVLVVNDQVLKTAWPGFLTGKASDVAGLIVAPLAVQAAVEVAAWRAGRWTGPSALLLAVAIVVVAVAFTAVQVWPPAVELYRWTLGVAQWPIRVLGAAVGGGAVVVGVVPVQATPDAGDLLALPAVLVTWWAGRRRPGPGRARATGGTS